jgi:hypothetical protein
MNLALELDKAVESHSDRVVPRSDFLLAPTNGSGLIRIRRDKEPLFLTDHALGQLLTGMAIPAEFFKQLSRDTQLRVLKECLPKWRFGRPMLVREFTNTRRMTRAILSNRYSIIDNKPVYEELKDVLRERSYHLTSHHVDYEGMHLRFLNQERIYRLKHLDLNEEIMGGFHVRNNEVGFGTLRLDAIIYRLVCKNGMVVPHQSSMMRKRHVGGMDYTNLGAALRQAEDGMSESVEAFMNTALIQMNLQQRDWLHLQRVYGIPDKEARPIQRLYEEDEATTGTLFGLVNAITLFAQSTGVERRFQLEIIAGKVADDYK